MCYMFHWRQQQSCISELQEYYSILKAISLIESRFTHQRTLRAQNNFRVVKSFTKPDKIKKAKAKTQAIAKVYFNITTLTLLICDS